MKTRPPKRSLRALLCLILVLCSAAVLHAEDCAPDADACSAKTSRQSPFLQASAVENAKTPAAEKVSRAPVKTGPVAPAVVPAVAPAVAVSPAPPEVSSAPPAAGGLASPAWLLPIAGGLAGLYFYLRGGNKKRRRR